MTRGDDRLFILGAGRAGRGLARAFLSAGVPLSGLHGRHAEPAARGTPAVSAGAIPAAAREATVAIVAVRDAQLDGALRELAPAVAPGAILLHLSGGSEPAGLGALRAAGHPAGTFHPLLPLADPESASLLFRGAWIGIDGDTDARAAARRLAGRLGARVLEIPAGEKARYHAAAVVASNFPTVLAALAEGLMTRAGVPVDAAAGAVRSLMGAALSNLADRRPAAALTGPVARGDAATVRRHLEALANDEAARDAYLTLSRAALVLAREAGLAPDAADALERALGR